jgi:hypothetical protein
LTDIGQELYYDCVIDFWIQEETDISTMASLLDQKLWELNADYASARSLEYLTRLRLTRLAPNTIQHWMSHRNKVWWQAKIPRLSMSRKHIVELLAL